MKKVIGFNLPEKLMKEFAEKAKEQKRSASAQLEYIIEQWLKNNKK